MSTITNPPSAGLSPVSGPWTPILGGSGGQSGQTYGAQQGRVIRMGPLVYLSFLTSLSAKGTITGNLQFSGLPYPHKAPPVGRPVCALAWSNFATSHLAVFGFLDGGSSVISILGRPGGSAGTGWVNLTTADISDTTYCAGYITYETDAP